jgi:hypothetical protein
MEGSTALAASSMKSVPATTAAFGPLAFRFFASFSFGRFVFLGFGVPVLPTSSLSSLESLIFRGPPRCASQTKCIFASRFIRSNVSRDDRPSRRSLYSYGWKRKRVSEGGMKQKGRGQRWQRPRKHGATLPAVSVC